MTSFLSVLARNSSANNAAGPESEAEVEAGAEAEKENARMNGESG